MLFFALISSKNQCIVAFMFKDTVLVSVLILTYGGLRSYVEYCRTPICVLLSEMSKFLDTLITQFRTMPKFVSPTDPEPSSKNIRSNVLLLTVGQTNKT